MEVYRNLIETFSKLDRKTKREEIKDELQETLMVFEKLCRNKKVKGDLLLHEQMKNLERDDISEDDCLNAIYSYIIAIEERMGDFFQKQINI